MMTTTPINTPPSDGLSGEDARHFVRTYPDVCRALRLMLGLSLEQLAAELGTNIVRLHYYETAQRVPRPNMAIRYVEFLMGRALDEGIDPKDVMIKVLSREREEDGGPVAVLRAARAHVKEEP